MDSNSIPPPDRTINTGSSADQDGVPGHGRRPLPSQQPDENGFYTILNSREREEWPDHPGGIDDLVAAMIHHQRRHLRRTLCMGEGTDGEADAA